MKIKTYSPGVSRVGLVLASALALGAPLGLLAAEPATGKAMPMSGGHMMDAEHGTMMADNQKMMADLTAQDAELAGLVTKMHQASKDKKVDLMADIVTRLVAQQQRMHTHMAKMHAHMERMHAMMKDDSMGSSSMMKDMDMKPKEVPAETN